MKSRIFGRLTKVLYDRELRHERVNELIYLPNDKLNRQKLQREIIFIKYNDSVVSFIFVRKALISNKMVLSASNSLNLLELLENELFLSNLPVLYVKILKANN